MGMIKLLGAYFLDCSDGDSSDAWSKLSNGTVYVCVVYCKLICCNKADKNKEYGAYVGLSPLLGQRNPLSNQTDKFLVCQPY